MGPQRGTVLEKDDRIIKNSCFYEFKRGLRKIGIDWLSSCVAKDHGKHHEPEPINQSRLEHASYQTDAANGSKWISILLFEGSDLLRAMPLF